MYHPPNQKSLPDNLLDISESNLLVGDLNAKHSSWGSLSYRGSLRCVNCQLRHLPFLQVDSLQDIGSDHLPILVELKWKQLTQLVKKNFGTLKGQLGEKYRDTVDRGLLSKPPFECRSIDDLDESWLSFKKIIFKAADYNRTSAYLITWTNRHRLKRNSPFSRMQAIDLLDQDIEEHFLKNVFWEGLKVHFKPEMGAHTSKNQDISLEIINKIPATAMQIYTDGSKDEQNSCGSGIFIKGS
ncbi:hypothetical protein TNCV_1862481 [Trichonephila clavipes]|nr:hypothetical protein TNCV_1862481 [Trichonephila clavipes]